MDLEKIREQYLDNVEGSSYLDWVGVKSEQYIQWLEQELVKNLTIPVVVFSEAEVCDCDHSHYEYKIKRGNVCLGCNKPKKQT